MVLVAKGRIMRFLTTEKLQLKLSNETTALGDESMKMSHVVSDIGRMDTFKLHNARTVSSLSLPIQSISIKKLQAFFHLRAISLEKMLKLNRRSGWSPVVSKKLK